MMRERSASDEFSADNNNSEKVLDAFSPVKDKYKIILASRYECGEVVRIG